MTDLNDRHNDRLLRKVSIIVSKDEGRASFPSIMKNSSNKKPGPVREGYSIYSPTLIFKSIVPILEKS